MDMQGRRAFLARPGDDFLSQLQFSLVFDLLILLMEYFMLYLVGGLFLLLANIFCFSQKNVMFSSNMKKVNSEGWFPSTSLVLGYLSSIIVRCLRFPASISVFGRENLEDDDKPYAQRHTGITARVRRCDRRFYFFRDDLVDLVVLGLHFSQKSSSIEHAAAEGFVQFCEKRLRIGGITPTIVLAKPAKGKIRSLVRVSLPAGVAYEILGQTCHLGHECSISIDRWMPRSVVNVKWQRRREFSGRSDDNSRQRDGVAVPFPPAVNTAIGVASREASSERVS